MAKRRSKTPRRPRKKAATTPFRPESIPNRAQRIAELSAEVRAENAAMLRSWLHPRRRQRIAEALADLRNLEDDDQ